MANKETELEKLMFAAEKVGQALKLPYSAAKGKEALSDNIADMYNLPRSSKKKAAPAAPIMSDEVKEIRKKKRKERNASRERTEMPSKKMREDMAKGYKDGGEAVPKKFKGFSKLPEAVQQNMDPELANKYRDGGEARNSGSKGSCRGMGAAMRGGSFSGVK
tara:strand:+ start:776 stop:1261 length:486 start_codon:yes stop_codon:yes gene_type:complete